MINISNLGMIDAQLITKLYLYGQQNPQSNYNDRIRPSDATNPTITIDMYAYMTQGPGRYATPERSVAFGAFFEEQRQYARDTFYLGDEVWAQDRSLIGGFSIKDEVL